MPRRALPALGAQVDAMVAAYRASLFDGENDGDGSTAKKRCVRFLCAWLFSVLGA
jgi:hypothetical protein